MTVYLYMGNRAEYMREYARKNRERIREHKLRYNAANPEKVVASKRAYYERNKAAVTLRASSTTWARTGPRAVSWRDRAAIDAFYAGRPEGMVVDHVIPLHADNVSGLHVLANLQYLNPAENKRKGNTWPSTK